MYKVYCICFNYLFLLSTYYTHCVNIIYSKEITDIYHYHKIKIIIVKTNFQGYLIYVIINIIPQYTTFSIHYILIIRYTYTVNQFII